MSSLDPLGAALERTVPAKERHARGQYFTPDAVVRFILDLVGESREAPKRVLDPACGSGRFLLGARERWGAAGLELLGYETDPAAAHRAATQLRGASIFGRSFLEAPAEETVDLVVGNPPYVRRRGLKRDLYVDFIERSLDHLDDGGRFAFVLSNAWLSVGYGRAVRELLLERCAIEWVIESTVESWFPGASVNTMVLVARRCDDAARRGAQSVCFAHLNTALPAEPQVVRRIPQARLPKEQAWAPLLRAPDLFLDLVSSDLTCSLGQLADLRRGFTTNDNALFYPPEGSGIEEQFLAPLVKGPRDLPGVRCRVAQLRYRVLLCDLEWDALQAKGATGLMRWLGRHRKGPRRPGWRLRPQRPARLFLAKGYHDRFRQALADVPVFADQQIYGVYSKDPLDDEILAALLNSAWFQLALELTGRVNFGDGVLWLGLKDARERLWVPNPMRWSAASRERLRECFDGLPEGRVPVVGNLRSSTTWGPAREKLDRELAHALGVSWTAYRELQIHGEQLCHRRLSLAKSRRVAGRSAQLES